ncbi:hypothetical protein ABEF94_016908 [Exophiala dermatitidis]
MFILTTFEDLVQIPPYGFLNNQITREDLEDRINEKYSNKVVQKVGLCICMYDLLKASDGLIGNGTGNANVNVRFRMIVFRPFKGEIMTGTVQRCTPEGIHNEQTWIWKTGDASLYFDPATVVNLRVESEKWHDQAPKGPQTEGEADKQTDRKVPYAIEASMAESGLGGVDWW